MQRARGLLQCTARAQAPAPVPARRYAQRAYNPRLHNAKPMRPRPSRGKGARIERNMLSRVEGLGRSSRGVDLTDSHRTEDVARALGVFRSMLMKDIEPAAKEFELFYVQGWEPLRQMRVVGLATVEELVKTSVIFLAYLGASRQRKTALFGPVSRDTEMLGYLFFVLNESHATRHILRDLMRHELYAEVVALWEGIHFSANPVRLRAGMLRGWDWDADFTLVRKQMLQRSMRLSLPDEDILVAYIVSKVAVSYDLPRVGVAVGKGRVDVAVGKGRVDVGKGRSDTEKKQAHTRQSNPPHLLPENPSLPPRPRRTAGDGKSRLDGRDASDRVPSILDGRDASDRVPSILDGREPSSTLDTPRFIRRVGALTSQSRLTGTVRPKVLEHLRLTYPYTDTASRCQQVVRQVALAQRWGDPETGTGISLQVRQHLRRRQLKEVRALWDDLNVAISDRHLRWVSLDHWERGNHIAVDEGDAAQWEALKPEEEDMDDEEALADAAEPAVARSPGATRPGRIGHLADPELIEMLSTENCPNFFLSQAVIGNFLSAFIRLGREDLAESVLHKLTEIGLRPGVGCYNGLLMAYNVKGDIMAMDRVYNRMQKEGLKPNITSHALLVRTYMQLKRTREAMAIYERLKEQFDGKYQPHKYLFKEILIGLLKNNEDAKALKFLDELDANNVKMDCEIYNIFLSHYVQHRSVNFEAVSELLSTMEEKGVQPDIITYTIILKAMILTKQKDGLTQVLQNMANAGIEPNYVTYGTMIAYLCKSGSIDEIEAASEIINRMLMSKMEPNEFHYTPIIQAFLKLFLDSMHQPLPGQSLTMVTVDRHPYFAAALKLKKVMEARGVHLNRVVYNSFIGAAMAPRSHSGMELALELYGEMKGTGMSLNYTWLILLEGLNQMKEYKTAMVIIKDMREVHYTPNRPRMRKVLNQINANFTSSL